MDEPSEDLRVEVGEMIGGIRGGSEELLEELLDRIEREIAAAAESFTGGEDPEELIATCHAWASLLSHAVGGFYGPASPWPRKVAGWGKAAIQKLNSAVSHLHPPLTAAQQKLGAKGFSIGVQFPWGIGISFDW